MMTIEAINIVLLILMFAFVLAAIVLKDVLKAVLSLAAGSAVLSIIFYLLAAPYAAVFAISVTAGLITVLFVLVISLTRYGSNGEENIMSRGATKKDE